MGSPCRCESRIMAGTRPSDYRHGVSNYIGGFCNSRHYITRGLATALWEHLGCLHHPSLLEHVLAPVLPMAININQQLCLSRPPSPSATLGFCALRECINRLLCLGCCSPRARLVLASATTHGTRTRLLQLLLHPYFTRRSRSGSVPPYYRRRH